MEHQFVKFVRDVDWFVGVDNLQWFVPTWNIKKGKASLSHSKKPNKYLKNFFDTGRKEAPVYREDLTVWKVTIERIESTIFLNWIEKLKKGKKSKNRGWRSYSSKSRWNQYLIYWNKSFCYWLTPVGKKRDQ